MVCTSLRVLGKDGHELDINQFHANINIQLSTAFVTLVGEFRVKSDGAKILEFPSGSNITVTNCTINTEHRSIGTCVVSEEELISFGAKNPKFQPNTVQVDKTKFVLPFEVGHKDKSVHVTLKYFYALPFDAETGRYTFHLPSTFTDPSHIESASIKFSVNSASPSQYVQYGCISHKFKQVSDSDPWLKNFEVDGWENRDFEFSYQITTTEILSTVLVNHSNVDLYDPRATFCVNIHPPPDSNLTSGFFGRRVVFLIDISGSMEKDPIAQAKNALHTGLTQLRHMWDHFTIIAFNNSLLTWSESLVEANPASIQAAIDWVGGLQAKGQTDILLAVQAATSMLNNPAFAGDNRIPMVFLLTDGAVDNEKDIHKYVVERCQHVRFHTLGIGDEANAYFLKMLAMAGRGLNDHIVNYKNIFKQVLSLIRAATTPILTNIEVLLPVQSNQYEIFPYPVPDLFCGHPIMLAGKVAVNFDHALVRGMLPNGQTYQVQVKPQFSNVELHKVFAKQRLDYMVGQAWATGNRLDIAAYSRYSSMYCMPTPHTVMVAYNKNPRKPHNDPPYSVSDLAIVSVGGVIVLAGLAFSLGSMIGTLNGISNIMAPDPFAGTAHTLHANNFGGGGGGGGNGDCCDCLDAAFCCCCNNEPCCGCCRPNRGRSNNFGNGGNASGDCCYWPNSYSGSGNDCCCNCNGCCDCGSGSHCGDCNTCCCNCSGDDMNCDCCGCDGGCVDCCSNCACDCGGCDCGGCDCGGCGDCGNCGGCDCNCNC